MFNYWYWSLRVKGEPETITIGQVVRTRYHNCEKPKEPRWVKSDDRYFFGLFRKKKLENPHSLEDMDVWTCSDCKAEWMLFGCYSGDGDI